MKYYNKRLKYKIIDSGLKGYEIERRAGLPYSKLSKIIYGIAEPTGIEKSKIANVLMVAESEIFSAPLIAA